VIDVDMNKLSSEEIIVSRFPVIS